MTLMQGGSFVIGQTQALNAPCHSGGHALYSNNNALPGGSGGSEANGGIGSSALSMDNAESSTSG